MTPEAHASINEGQDADGALHDEIKCRAYELYEQRPFVRPHLTSTPSTIRRH